MEQNIQRVTQNTIETNNTKYIFVNCIKEENEKGTTADQAIIDFREPMRSIAEEIVKASCVPEQYKIIDDRTLGIWV